jgi:hypothetical protein
MEDFDFVVILVHGINENVIGNLGHGCHVSGIGHLDVDVDIGP